MALDLHGIYAEWEREERARREQSERLKELFKAAKTDGFNPKGLRVAFAEKFALDHLPAEKVAKRSEDANDADLYLATLSAPRRPAYPRVEKIEEFPAHGTAGAKIIEGMNEALAFAKGDETAARVHVFASNLQNVQNAQTEPQSAPSAARDLTVPPSPQGQVAPIPAEMPNQSEPDDAAVTAGDVLREPAAAEQGQNIWEGDAPRETDRLGGDASRPDTDVGEAQKVERRSPKPEDAGSIPAADANAGSSNGRTAAFDAVNAGSTPAPAPNTVDFKKKLRPHCLKPESCGGMGREHCWSCKKAMNAAGAA